MPCLELLMREVLRRALVDPRLNLVPSARPYPYRDFDALVGVGGTRGACAFDRSAVAAADRVGAISHGDLLRSVRLLSASALLAASSVRHNGSPGCAKCESAASA